MSQIEDNSEIKSTNQNHPIIIIDNKYDENNNENINNLNINSNNNKTHLNIHIITCVLSILMFTICAWASKVTFIEIVDLEIPLLILITFVFTECGIQGYFKISLIIAILASCIIYLFSPSYSFYFILALTSILIMKCIEKIYLNEYDFRCENQKRSSNKYIEHLQRVKYYLLLSATLFIIFMLLGYFYPSVFQSVVLPSIQGMSEGVKEGTVKLETLSLFVNNMSVAINMIFGGFYFSMPTIYLLIFNALFIGYYACVSNLGYFLSFTIPHGIIELLGIIIAGAAGLRVTDAIISILSGIKINSKKRGEIFVEHVEICCKMFLDVLIMIIIATVLLIIAAYIEANLTLPVGQCLMGMM